MPRWRLAERLPTTRAARGSRSPGVSGSPSMRSPSSRRRTARRSINDATGVMIWSRRALAVVGTMAVVSLPRPRHRSRPFAGTRHRAPRLADHERPHAVAAAGRSIPAGRSHPWPLPADTSSVRARLRHRRLPVHAQADARDPAACRRSSEQVGAELLGAMGVTAAELDAARRTLRRPRAVPEATRAWRRPSRSARRCTARATLGSVDRRGVGAVTRGGGIRPWR